MLIMLMYTWGELVLGAQPLGIYLIPVKMWNAWKCLSQVTKLCIKSFVILNVCTFFIFQHIFDEISSDKFEVIFLSHQTLETLKTLKTIKNVHKLLVSMSANYFFPVSILKSWLNYLFTVSILKGWLNYFFPVSILKRWQTWNMQFLTFRFTNFFHATNLVLFCFVFTEIDRPHCHGLDAWCTENMIAELNNPR